jgi:hypothetical protein
MQSIFRPASRREVLGERSEGSRRDGGLKMGWTKPLGCDVAMGVDCRLYFEDPNGPKVVRVRNAQDESLLLKRPISASADSMCALQALRHDPCAPAQTLLLPLGRPAKLARSNLISIS